VGWIWLPGKKERGVRSEKGEDHEGAVDEQVREESP